MTTATDHDALISRMRDAREAEHVAYKAVRTSSATPGSDLYIAWRETAARHAALIEAGLILTLGNGEDT